MTSVLRSEHIQTLHHPSMPFSKGKQVPKQIDTFIDEQSKVFCQLINAIIDPQKWALRHPSLLYSIDYASDRNVDSSTGTSSLGASRVFYLAYVICERLQLGCENNGKNTREISELLQDPNPSSFSYCTWKGQRAVTSAQWRNFQRLLSMNSSFI